MPGCFDGRHRARQLSSNGGQACGLGSQAMELKQFGRIARWQRREWKAKRPSRGAGRTSAGDPALYQRHSAPGLMRTRRRRVEIQFLRITWMKLQRAYGGCLGVKRRRRTWNTAKSLGEPCAGAISGDVRMGKPTGPSQDESGISR